ncbi:MAG: hypothetical protein ACFCBW_06025 [Candidatus Competibacterales bacterium]
MDRNAEALAPLRLLWVGNSHTTGFDVPGKLKGLAPVPVVNRVLAAGGLSLGEHLEGKRLRHLLAADPPWNRLILQERSWVAMVAPHALIDALDALFQGPLARREAAVVLCQNWAFSPRHARYYRLLPQETPQGVQRRLDGLFKALAERFGVAVAPVGHAIAQGHDPGAEVSLVADDGSHLSPQGATVAALVIHHTLFGHLPPPTAHNEALWALAQTGCRAYGAPSP